MQHPQVRVHQKRAFYGLQHQHTGLYARLKNEAPETPQPSEDSADGVVAKHGHVRFEPWQTATWFKSSDQAMAAFARYLGVAPVEIVRVEP